MTNPITPKERIMQIFFPYSYRKSEEIKQQKGRFVYYTSAETAASVIERRQVWMRNTMIMNDYREVEHGFDCLNAAYKGKPGTKFNAVLDSCFPGLAEEVNKLFNSWLPTIRHDSYITCLSEHLPSEDMHGRLSMWRAYGSQTGVALVLNSAVFFSDTDVLKAYSSPVAYVNQNEFSDVFFTIADQMKEATEFVVSLGREPVKNMVFNMFRFAVLCTKHPGFHEEREWRVVASPKMFPSDYLIPSLEVVRGIPQTVLKIDLINHEDKGLTGLAVPELLNRVIIGPCQYPAVVFKAFAQLLENAGIKDGWQKIAISDIPLRHIRGVDIG